MYVRPSYTVPATPVSVPVHSNRLSPEGNADTPADAFICGGGVGSEERRGVARSACTS